MGPQPWANGVLLSLLLVLLLAGAAKACPACAQAVGSQPSAARSLQGWARSIYLLMCTPYLLFGGIAFAIARSSYRRHHGK